MSVCMWGDSSNFTHKYMHFIVYELYFSKAIRKRRKKRKRRRPRLTSASRTLAKIPKGENIFSNLKIVIGNSRIFRVFQAVFISLRRF